MYPVCPSSSSCKISPRRSFATICTRWCAQQPQRTTTCQPNNESFEPIPSLYCSILSLLCCWQHKPTIPCTPSWPPLPGKHNDTDPAGQNRAIPQPPNRISTWPSRHADLILGGLGTVVLRRKGLSGQRPAALFNVGSHPCGWSQFGVRVGVGASS